MYTLKYIIPPILHKITNNSNSPQQTSHPSSHTRSSHHPDSEYILFQYPRPPRSNYFISTNPHSIIVKGANILPEKHPTILILISEFGIRRRGAGVRFAGSVGGAVGGVVLVVCFEDCEGLGLCPY